MAQIASLQKEQISKYFEALFDCQERSHARRSERRYLELCTAHVTGSHCVHSRNCHFAHGLEELLPRRQLVAHFKMRECDNFPFGCRFGTRCLFVHDDVIFQVTPEVAVYYSEMQQVYRVTRQCNESDVLAYSFNVGQLRHNPDFDELLHNLYIVTQLWPKGSPIRMFKHPRRNPESIQHSLIGLKKAYPGEKKSEVLKRLIEAQTKKSPSERFEDCHVYSKKTMCNQIAPHPPAAYSPPQMSQIPIQTAVPPLNIAGIPTFVGAPESNANASFLDLRNPYLNMCATPEVNYYHPQSHMVAGMPALDLNQLIVGQQQAFAYVSAQQDPQHSNTILGSPMEVPTTPANPPMQTTNTNPLMFPVCGGANAFYAATMYHPTILAQNYMHANTAHTGNPTILYPLLAPPLVNGSSSYPLMAAPLIEPSCLVPAVQPVMNPSCLVPPVQDENSPIVDPSFLVPVQDEKLPVKKLRENPNPVVQKFFNKVLENNINLTNVIISNEKSVAQPLALESLTLEVKQQSALNLDSLNMYLQEDIPASKTPKAKRLVSGERSADIPFTPSRKKKSLYSEARNSHVDGPLSPFKTFSNLMAHSTDAYPNF